MFKSSRALSLRLNQWPSSNYPLVLIFKLKRFNLTLWCLRSVVKWGKLWVDTACLIWNSAVHLKCCLGFSFPFKIAWLTRINCGNWPLCVAHSWVREKEADGNISAQIFWQVQKGGDVTSFFLLFLRPTPAFLCFACHADIKCSRISASGPNLYFPFHALVWDRVIFRVCALQQPFCLKKH